MKGLVVRDLCYTYRDGRSGLSGVNLEFDRGARVCLLGKNGSGKSTLLLHLNGLLNGDGYIEVMGLERSAKNMTEIRRKTGLLFSQVEHQFIMPELVNDILLGIVRNSDEFRRGMEIIEHFGLRRYEGKHPLELSSGEMKRAAVAGVIARGAEFLLLDEPLQNLDRENSEKLIATLKSLEVTMMIATHSRFLFEKIADYAAVMESGRITGFYKKEEALKRDEVLSLLL